MTKVRRRSAGYVQGAGLLFLVGALFGMRSMATEASPTLVLAAPGEPGERMVLEVTVVGEHGAPAPSLTWTVYQTDADGWYRRGPDGREQGGSSARLSGEIEPGSDGRFRLDTIRPAPYPGGGVPAHVHFHGVGSGIDVERTLHFEGDPDLAPRLRESTARRPLVALERDADGVWRGSLQLVVSER